MGKGVVDSGNVVNLVLIAVAAFLFFRFAKDPLGLKSISDSVTNWYTGTGQMQARTENQQQLWDASDAANQAREQGIGTGEFVFIPEWTGVPVVATSPISSSEYKKRQTEAQTWMNLNADDVGISAPYGSALYNQWAEQHPLTAYGELGFWDRTPYENLLYGTEHIENWLDSWW